MTAKKEQYLLTFAENLEDGIQYYYNMFDELKDKFEDTKFRILGDLDSCKEKLKELSFEIKHTSIVTA